MKEEFTCKCGSKAFNVTGIDIEDEEGWLLCAYKAILKCNKCGKLYEFGAYGYDPEGIYIDESKEQE